MSVKGLKIGDKCRVIESDPAHRTEIGTIITVVSKNEYGRPEFDNGGFCCTDGHLEKVNEAAEIGTVYLDGDNDEVTVLAVVGELVAISNYNEPEQFGEFVTLKQLKGRCTLKGAESEVKELTMQEVAELAGIDVDKLRIKE